MHSLSEDRRLIILFRKCIDGERVNSINAIRNPFTYRIPVIKLAVKELQSAKFYAILLVLVALVGIFSLSPVISSLMNDVVIRSTGQISTTPTNVTATSGSARDIQVAVNQVVAAGGIGNVFIPEGTFNFVDVGEPWMTVEIPAGINLFGAPTERTSGLEVPPQGMNPNDQVVEWRTILVMPYDVPGDWYNAPLWFRITGNGDPNKPSRFSDIKMVGYKSINPNSTMIHQGISIKDVVDFRVDHCCLEHAGTGGGIPTGGLYCRGLIDHCRLVNPNVEGAPPAYMDGIVGYGVALGRAYGDVWEDDISKVLGQYTAYTVFVEDCYLSKWRHCIAANNGAHYVIRHSTIENDFGFGTLDAHGWGVMTDGVITQVGTRAIELYNCQFLDPYNPEAPQRTLVFLRGGACIAFNNTVTGYLYFVSASRESSIEVPKCFPHDIYVWNNKLPSGVEPVHTITNEKGTPEEGVDYFLHPPHTFDYKPYPYPLTLETTP